MLSLETIEKTDHFLPLRLLVFGIEQGEGFFNQMLLGQTVRGLAQGMTDFREGAAHFGELRPVPDVVAVAEHVPQKRCVSGDVYVADVEFDKGRRADLDVFTVGVEAVFLPVSQYNQMRLRVGIEVAGNLFDKIFVPVDVFEVQLFGFDKSPAVSVLGKGIIHMPACIVDRVL